MLVDGAEDWITVMIDTTATKPAQVHPVGQSKKVDSYDDIEIKKHRSRFFPKSSKLPKADNQAQNIDDDEDEEKEVANIDPSLQFEFDEQMQQK